MILVPSCVAFTTLPTFYDAAFIIIYVSRSKPCIVGSGARSQSITGGFTHLRHLVGKCPDSVFVFECSSTSFSINLITTSVNTLISFQLWSNMYLCVIQSILQSGNQLIHLVLDLPLNWKILISPFVCIYA